MKNEMKYFKVVLISLVLSLFSHNIFAQQHKYIRENKSLAEKLSNQYEIPSAIMLAVAFVETGGGSSKGAKVYNNHFGIVGKNTVIKSRYKSFESVEASYEAFCKLITRKKFYSNLKGNTNYGDWVRAIAAAGYSTQPKEWMRRINMIIKQQNL